MRNDQAKLNEQKINKTIGIHRILHTMLRVKNLQASKDFYTEQLGMKILREKKYHEGQFTLIFLGYGNESDDAVIELTYNWGENDYDKGNAFGHIALAVTNIYEVCNLLAHKGVKISRQPGPMKADSSEIIAFVEDPDGYQIELIERKN